MTTIKTIAILGAACKMGAALAKALSRDRYLRFLVSGRDEVKLLNLVSDLQSHGANATYIECAKEACWEADIIILAAPSEADQEVANRIREVANGKIVIRIANPVASSHDDLTTPPRTSAAEELQKMLPRSMVVNAFNTMFAADFATPVIDGHQVDVFVSGNHPGAVGKVTALARSAGFNPIDAGDLTTSRTLEHMQSILMQFNKKYRHNGMEGWKMFHH